MRMIINIIMSH